jgi:4-hydroxy-4-methyl-2-oxoglutarate aldolase
MGGVGIAPGDYICADDDGIVILPAAEAARIVAAGQSRAAKEDVMMAQLKAGRTMVELLGLESKRGLAD